MLTGMLVCTPASMLACSSAILTIVVSEHDETLVLINKKPNKMPTNWWGRQTAAPLKFDSKSQEAAFFANEYS